MSDFLKRISGLSREQLVLLASKLEKRINEAPPVREAIAVVGIGCRFPGSDGPDEFWQFLENGGDAITEVPADRWDLDEVARAISPSEDCELARHGGFLRDVDRFDADFFGISKREADNMDPQQRLLLEITWQALENANIAPASLAGTQAGVFVGVCNSDFFVRQAAGDVGKLDMYTSTGAAHSVASGRLSYVMGLRGPAISVDTACSSSLIAVHLACQSLRLAECTVALAGGVNLMLLPEITVSLSRARMLSPDGHCKAFDSRANGFVRAEGCGMVVLKRLSDAERDGDVIQAVILGSASNQDGRSHGLTAPNGPSQEQVIRAALANSGLQSGDVTLIEAHGTGTSLGDPIEARALANVFGQRPAGSTLLTVGSVKSNIGHGESAAGIAGLIKLTLCARHGQIPASLHFEELNPHIDWEGLPIAVAREPRVWSVPNGRRIGGVSSFGFSGSNAHVLVAEPPPQADDEEPASGEAAILALSAHTESALKELAGRYAALLAQPGADAAAICRTAAIGRNHLAQRAALMVTSGAKAANDLRTLASGSAVEAAYLGKAASGAAPEVAFLFPGQGSQYAGMGRRLYTLSVPFRNAFDVCDAVSTELTGESLGSILFTDDDARAALVDRADKTQIAIFAVEYALAMMWRAFGVTPSLVIGHSAGEYAAACIAGVFELEDAIRLVLERGRLMHSLDSSGSMAAVFGSEQRVLEAIAPLGDAVSIAAVNGPENTVLSGPAKPLEQALALLEKRGIANRPLRIAHALHSPAVEPILDEFERAVAAVRMKPPTIDVVSNVTGAVADPGLLTTASYWRRHMREPVRFGAGIRNAYDRGHRLFVEVGAHPVLTGMAMASVEDLSKCKWLVTQKRDVDGWMQLLAAVGGLYAAGVDLNWRGLYGARRRPAALPMYPFQRERCWPDAGMTGAKPARRASATETEGRVVRAPGLAAFVVEQEFLATEPAFLRDHRIFGEIIMPSPVYVELAASAARRFAGTRAVCPFELTHFAVHEALRLPSDEPLAVQTHLHDNGRAPARFEVHAEDASGWRKYASGRIVHGVAPAPDVPAFAREEWIAGMQEGASRIGFYDQLVAMGLEFGRAFQGLSRCWKKDGAALGEIRLPAGLAGGTGDYAIHPAMLDACLHLLGEVMPQGGRTDPYLLVGIDRLRVLSRAGAVLWARTAARPRSSGEMFAADMWLYDNNGTAVAAIEGIQLKRAASRTLTPGGPKLRDDIWYDVNWVPLTGSPSGYAGPGPAGALRDALTSRVTELAELHDVHGYDKALDVLEERSIGYVSQALSELGWMPRVGAQISVAETAEALGILAQHHRLFRRMLSMLAEECYLEEDADTFIVARPLPAAGPITRSRGASSDAARCPVESSLLERCGGALAGVLTGSRDPIALLFPGGEFAAVEGLYRDTPYARTCNNVVRRALEACFAAEPGNHRLRVLEIGAGTGGTTREVLKACIPGRTEYVFTDVSPLFLERARTTFADHDFLKYALLDIERDPISQGFEAGGFDVIIAANVLHATASLRKSVGNAAMLLKEGGCLLPLEGTRRMRWVDLTFGMTEGWWKFDDTDLRPDYPLLATSRWLEVLRDTDLDAAALIESGVERPPQEVFLACRQPAAHGCTSLPAERSLLTGSDDEAVKTLAARMQAAEAVPASDVAGHLNPLIRNVIFIANGGIEDSHQIAGENGIEDSHQIAGECLAVSRLVDVLYASGTKARLFVVTQGAQPVAAGAEADPAQAALWGLGRVIALEHPDLWGGLLDLDPAAHDAAADLEKALADAGDEDQLAIRGGELLAARLVRAAPPPATVPDLSRNGSYLVTGGLGGLGLEVGAWLARRGAGLVVLQTRRAWPTEGGVATGIAEGIRRIEAAGARVKVQTADVADEASMSDLFSKLAADGLPVRGVVHGAVEMSQCPVRELSELVLSSMFAAKVAGTRVLDRLTRDANCDWFVMFSSTTALLGVGGLGHYAAANQYMDALAVQRCRDGLRTISINWGTWELMRVASRDDRERFEAGGLRPLSVDAALAAMEEAMGSGRPGHVIADIDWAVLKPLYEARRRRPFLAGVENSVPARSAAASTPEAGGIRVKLAQASSEDTRRSLLQEYLSVTVSSVLGTSGAVAPDRGFFDMGMDSLMAVELRSRLERELGLELPSTLTFNYPSIAALTDMIDGELGAVRVSGFEPRANAGPSLRERIEAVSRDEAQRILTEHVAREASGILGRNRDTGFPIDRGLFDMGMDSLMAVELKSRLEKALACELPSTLTFNYPTVDAIVAFLLSEALGVFASVAAPVGDEAGQPADEPSSTDLGVEELAQALRQKLETIKFGG